MVSPIWGAVLAGIMISVALLVIGFQIIAAGLTGRKVSLTEK
ncbi:hypothetical protein BH23THE1_BH23THE1_20390 [soil metagenome]